MKFMPFDFDHQIQSYNQAKNKSLKRSDFAFLRALNDDSMVAFNLANELLQKSAQIGPQKSTEKPGSLLDSVSEQIENNDYTGIRQSLKKLGQYITNDNTQSWYIEQHRRLKNPEFWEQISTLPATKSAQAQLENLKRQWLSEQSQFSAHGVSSLCFAATSILSFFENYYDFARLEFRMNQYNIPKKIRLAYREHLLNTKNIITDLKQRFCQNMLLRLQLAVATGDIHYSDHIHHTKQFLHRHRLIKQQSHLPSYRRNDLESANFPQFLYFIVQYGTEIQKSSLNKIALFTTDEQYVAWQNSETIILAPRIFHDRGLIPHSPVWFPRLFKQRQFRYQFFEKNVWLVSSLRMLEKYPLENIDFSASIDHIREIESKLNQADQEIQANSTNRIFSVIFYKSTLLNFEWRHYYNNARVIILKKKMALIAFIDKNLKQHNASLLDFGPINTIIDEISSELSRVHLPSKDCESFYIHKASLVSNQASVSKKPSAPLARPMVSTNPFDEPKASTNPFDKPNRTDPILLDLVQNLKLMTLDKNDFNETISSINNAIISIRQSPSLDEQKLLRKVFKNIFIQYLKHVNQMNSLSEVEENKEKLCEVEQLLLSHSEEHIRSRIQSNIDCRREANYFFSLKIKCRSYLASYQPKLSPLLVSNSAILTTHTPARVEELPTPQLIHAQ